MFDNVFQIDILEFRNMKLVIFFFFFKKGATGTVGYDYTSEDNTHNIRWGRVLYIVWGRVLDSIAETTTQTTLTS